MPSSSSEFAFQTGAEQFHELANSLDSLPTFDHVEGEGATVDAVNKLLQEQRQWESAMSMKASEIAQACEQQHGVDTTLAQAPSVQDVKEAEQRFHDAKGEDKIHKLSEYREIKEEHAAAVATHASGTDPTVSTLAAVEMPVNPLVHGSGGNAAQLGDPSTPLPMTDPGTSLSGDTDLGGTPTPALDRHGYPQMPQAQMPLQPQAMPSSGAGGSSGYPSIPPMGSPNRGREKPAEGKDPLDDLRTALAGDGDTPVPTPVPVDRGTTARGVTTKADVTGLNRPAVGNVAVQPVPPPPPPMMSGPMGAGVPGGGGGGKPKPRPDIKSADPEQHGHDSIADAVEGGILGSVTSTEPKFKDEQPPRAKADTPHVLGDYPWERA